MAKYKLSKKHFKRNIITKFLLQMCLHIYRRASMEQTQFNALGLLHINYDTNVDFDNITDLFANNKEKVLEFNICDINSD